MKKISSFANTFGGFMIVGAKASSVDGRIEDLPGVETQPGYKQTVVQWCFDAANPPLTVEVSDPIPTPAGNGKVCYVVYTAESDVAPHFLNGRKGIYLRTDEFSARFEARLANESELRHLFDRRKLIRERRLGLLDRARKRFNTYASRKCGDLGARLEVCMIPRFPARPLCEQARLTPLVEKSVVNWLQVGFPKLGNSIVSQYESVIILSAAGEFSIFEANIWGLLYYGTSIGKNAREIPGIHINQFVDLVLVFIRHASKMLQALGYLGPVLIETALASVLGSQWLCPWVEVSFNLGPDQSSTMKLYSRLRPRAKPLRDKPDDVAIDVLRYVLFSVNLLTSQGRLSKSKIWSVGAMNIISGGSRHLGSE